jgi:O-acetylserine/cysteine efflux transporter
VKSQHRNPILALAAAGALWGLTVPLSKLALSWLGPGWLTVARFVLAAPLLAFAGRRGLRDALTARVAVAGAIGFGAVIVLQNAGIQRTSVSHAAVVVGAVPVLVALITAGLGHAAPRPRGWGGYALALGGIGLVAGSGGGGATPVGDLLVLVSAVFSAGFISVQPRLLAGRDAAAVTAVQLAAGAIFATPIAFLTEGVPPHPTNAVPIVAVAALGLAGTLVPFWLFAFGQAHVPAQLAGAFVNLEPVVGAAAGWVAFGDPAAVAQLIGAAAVIAGIALSTIPASSDCAASSRTGPCRRGGLSQLPRALRLERYRRLRCGDVEAEALLQVQPDDIAVVGVIADRQVLARLEDEVAASLADHDRTLDPGRPDDRTLEDLPQVLEQRVSPMLRGLRHTPVLLASER